MTHQSAGQLNSRDREFLRLLASGLTGRELATAMEASASAIQSRQRRLCAKVGVNGTPELVRFAKANTHPGSSRVPAAEQRSGVTILQTKLHPPHTPSAPIPRPRLLDRLNENIRRPLTLVSAPAGYGKSTLVVQWLDAADMRSAWLSLGQTESELRAFLAYFIAAVQTRFPKSCSRTAALLQASQLPPTSTLVGWLSNDLEDLSESLILVLDDYYLIQDSQVHDFLDDLLHFLPHPLHLVITTRIDPPLSLASMRAKGLVVEIRQADLRFSESEAGAVMKQEARVDLNHVTLSQLDKEMEGWIVGLRLLGLALRNRKDPERYLSQVKGRLKDIDEYLVTEVLSRQSAAMERWLVTTSVLDRFCAPLCDAISSRPPEPGAPRLKGVDFIAALQQSNLFAINLDSQGEWFRYHHLFQGLLRQRLGRSMTAAEIARIHFQASEWFEAEGFLDDAIHHALAADNPVRAARIVEAHRDTEFTADRWHVVEHWLARLPADLKQTRPKILLTEAWIGNLRHQMAQVTACLQQAEALIQGQAVEPMLSGELAFLQGYLDYFEGEGERSRRRLEEAVSQLSGNKTPFLGEAELMLGLARCMVGQKQLAVGTLNERIDRVGQSEGQLRSRCIAGLAFIHLVCGDMPRARVEAQRLQLVAKQHGMGLTDAWSSYMGACTYLHSGELAAALDHFAQAAEQRYILEPRAAVDALAGLALTQQLMGLDDEAADSVRRLHEYAQELNERSYLSVAGSCQARIALLQGNLTAASGWAQSFGDQSTPAELFCWLEVPSITHARCLAGAGKTEGLREATDLLRAIRQQSEAARFTCQAIEVAVLQSMVMARQGHPDKALSTLDEGLALTEPGGWIRPFVELGQPMADLLKRLRKRSSRAEQIDRVLAAFPKEEDRAARMRVSTRSTQPALIEPLTNREQDTLALLAKRLYDKEIADALSVSTETVKTHLKHIYQKLQVGNRRQAIIKAHELGLLRSGDGVGE